jgi:hypothetical protein
MEEITQTSAPENLVQNSTFDGTTWQLIGWRLLGFFLSAITLGIAAPWAQCMIYRWQAKHSLVEGQRLHFDGKGHQLLGKYLLWGLLILITFGIYTIFLPVRVRKWHVSHLSFATGKEEDNSSRGLAALIAVAVVGAVVLLIVLGSVLPKVIDMDIFNQILDTFPSSPTESTATVPSDTDPANATTVPESVWYVNIDIGLRVRKEPNTDSDVLRNLKYGTEVNVEKWKGPWANIGDGWVYGDYLSKEKPKTDSGTTSLTGTWTNAGYDKDSGRLILNGNYTLNADGSFSGAFSNRTYLYNAEEGWVYDYTAGAGGEQFSGRYRYDGRKLTLDFEYMEWDSPEPDGEYDAYIDGGVLYIDSDPYYAGSVNEIGNRLCPNPMP